MMRVKVPLRAVAAVIPAFVLCIAFLLGSTHLLILYSNNVSYPAYAERAAPWERPFFIPCPRNGRPKLPESQKPPPLQSLPPPR
mgnify:CR=1 FL=1